jgi:hypothetical protein
MQEFFYCCCGQELGQKASAEKTDFSTQMRKCLASTRLVSLPGQG